MKNFKLLLGALIVSSQFFACKPDDKKKEDILPALEIPSSYDATNFETNAATEIAVMTQLNNLVNEIKKGRTSGVKVDLNTLNNLYTTGNPSLKTLNTTYYNSKIEGAGAWLDELSKASGNIYTPSATITGDGGYFGKYLFEEHGLELEQKIEKGMFGSVLYNHFITLIKGSLDQTTADKIMAILGSNPTLPSSNVKSDKNPKPDMGLATYIARRDKNDGNGFYSQFSANIRKLQAAIKAGDKYKREQLEAINAIKVLVEQANAATIINYCKTVISTMSQTSTTDDQKGAALHAYGECVGFLHGWKTLPQEHKIISDIQIDELLTLLNAPHDKAPSSYIFITDPSSSLNSLVTVQERLKAIYNFSDQQMNDFAKNWVAEQNR